MKTNKLVYGLFGLMALASCSDKMDYSETVVKDKDYVIHEGEIVIVDEFTGRMMPGRRYSDGLHQAIEAKENVQVRRESKTLATTTFQLFQ